MRKLIQLLSATMVTGFLIFGNSCKKAETNTCAQPTGLTNVASGTTSSAAELKWSATTGATYQVQIRAVNTTTWQQCNTTKSDTIFGGLSSGTTYEWQVKNTCSSTAGFVSGPQFTTTGCPTGYEGTNCNTKVNAKFVGSFNVQDTAVFTNSPTQVFAYLMTVTASANDPNSITLSDFGGFGPGFGPRATVQGSNFTVVDTTIGTITFTNGHGSISANTLTFTYTSSDTTGSATSHAVGLR